MYEFNKVQRRRTIGKLVFPRTLQPLTEAFLWTNKKMRVESGERGKREREREELLNGTRQSSPAIAIAVGPHPLTANQSSTWWYTATKYCGEIPTLCGQGRAGDDGEGGDAVWQNLTSEVSAVVRRIVIYVVWITLISPWMDGCPDEKAHSLFIHTLSSSVQLSFLKCLQDYVHFAPSSFVCSKLDSFCFRIASLAVAEPFNFNLSSTVERNSFVGARCGTSSRVIRWAFLPYMKKTQRHNI